MIAAVLLIATGPAQACPLCKEGSTLPEDRTETVTDAAGFNLNGSVYGLLGGVTAVAGVAGLAMVRATRAQ